MRTMDQYSKVISYLNSFIAELNPHGNEKLTPIQLKSTGSSILNLELYDSNGQIISSYAVKLYNTEEVKLKNEPRWYKVVLRILMDYNFKVNNFYSNPGNYFAEFQQDFPSQSNILVMDNLKSKHFQNIAFNQGLDLKTAKLVLHNLSHLHALVIAMKINDRQIYLNQLKSHIVYQSNSFSISKNRFWILDLLGYLRNDLKATGNEQDLNRLFKTCTKDNLLETVEVVEPFGSLILGNCSIDNILVRFESKEPKEIKFVDLNSFCYGSIASDFLRFYFTSLPNYLLQDYNVYNELLDEYFESLQKHLKLCGVDEEFCSRMSKIGLVKEVERIANYQEFLQILAVINNVLNSKRKMNLPREIFHEFHRDCRDKIVTVFKIFIHNNWI